MLRLIRARSTTTILAVDFVVVLGIGFVARLSIRSDVSRPAREASGFW